MSRHIIAIALLLLAAGCTSSEEHRAKMNRWIGVSEKELVTSWGVPDKQYDVDRRTRMLAYVDSRNVTYGGTFSTCMGGVGGRFGYGHCIGGYPPSTENHYCETTFMLVSGKVANWGHKGNGCRY